MKFPELERCECGLMPTLEKNTTDYAYRTAYCYFCDCDETGCQAASPKAALLFWNHRKELRNEMYTV